jgi:hypothetical protein
MKIIAALLSLFSRRKADEPDHFEKRLTSLTAPQNPRRPSPTKVSPVLFRRELHHA